MLVGEIFILYYIMYVVLFGFICQIPKLSPLPGLPFPLLGNLANGTTNLITSEKPTHLVTRHPYVIRASKVRVSQTFLPMHPIWLPVTNDLDNYLSLSYLVQFFTVLKFSLRGDGFWYAKCFINYRNN